MRAPPSSAWTVPDGSPWPAEFDNVFNLNEHRLRSVLAFALATAPSGTNPHPGQVRYETKRSVQTLNGCGGDPDAVLKITAGRWILRATFSPHPDPLPRGEGDRRCPFVKIEYR